MPAAAKCAPCASPSAERLTAWISKVPFNWTEVFAFNRDALAGVARGFVRRFACCFSRQASASFPSQGKVELTGITGTKVDAKGYLSGAGLSIPRVEDVRIITPAPEHPWERSTAWSDAWP